MATVKNEVQVKYTADTKQYTKAVGSAEKANTALTNSVDDFGNAAKQTTEGAIDSLTGTSGLGAAFTSVAGRVKDAAKGLSTFSKALIATGIGAALAAITLIITNWEKISELIGDGATATERFAKEQEDLDRVAQLTTASLRRQAALLKAMGLTEGAAEAEKSALQVEMEAAERAAKTLGKTLENELKLLDPENQGWLHRFFFGKSETEIEELEADLTAATETAKDIQNQIDIAAASETELTPDVFDEGDTTITDFIEEQRLLAQVGQDAFNKAVEEGKMDLLDIEDEANDELYEQDIKAIKKRIADREKLEKEAAATAAEKAKEDAKTIEEAKGAIQTAGFDALLLAFEENQKAVGAILIAEAISNIAVAITAATKFPLTAPFVIPAIVATGAVQIATIAKQMGTSGDSVSGGGGGFTPTIEDTQIETATIDNPRPQVVLVTEDLDRVQNQVTVTNDRSSLG